MSETPRPDPELRVSAMAVSFKELLETFELMGMANPLGECEAILCKQTGKIYYRSVASLFDFEGEPYRLLAPLIDSVGHPSANRCQSASKKNQRFSCSRARKIPPAGARATRGLSRVPAPSPLPRSPGLPIAQARRFSMHATTTAACVSPRTVGASSQALGLIGVTGRFVQNCTLTGGAPGTWIAGEVST
jgi:hypothetical protein